MIFFDWTDALPSLSVEAACWEAAWPLRSHKPALVLSSDTARTRTSPTPVFNIPDAEWDKIINTNLRGVFHSCRVFGKQMIDQRSGGSIINISSVSSELPLSRV